MRYVAEAALQAIKKRVERYFSLSKRKATTPTMEAYRSLGLALINNQLKFKDLSSIAATIPFFSHYIPGPRNRYSVISIWIIGRQINAI
jgi:Tfp pilus assembly protein PilE